MKNNRKYPWRESTLALPPGRWINRPGGVKRFEVAQPELQFQDDDISTNTVEQEVWDAIAANLTAVTPIAEPPTRALCDDCGCLLAPAERCPRCLVWALKAEREWEQQRERWANRDVIWTILDQRKAAA